MMMKMIRFSVYRLFSEKSNHDYSILQSAYPSAHLGLLVVGLQLDAKAPALVCLYDLLASHVTSFANTLECLLQRRHACIVAGLSAGETSTRVGYRKRNISTEDVEVLREVERLVVEEWTVLVELAKYVEGVVKSLVRAFKTCVLRLTFEKVWRWWVHLVGHGYKVVGLW